MKKRILRFASIALAAVLIVLTVPTDSAFAALSEGSADILYRVVVFDNILVTQDFYLAVRHLDFHIFIQYAAGLVVQCFGIGYGCAAPDI